MNVSFKVRGIEKLEKFLKDLPYGGVKVALEAFVEYVVGNKSHGLRHDEPQKYVSRARAGYKTSAAQMRYFFAVRILERIGNTVRLNRYKRTGETAAAWTYQMVSPWKYKIINPKAGAYWTRDESGQTRQHKLAGRRKVSKVVDDNMRGGIRHAVAALNKWMNDKL